MTVPSCGFSLAVSGITMPDAVVVSASFAWTRIRSSSGLIATLVAVVTGIPSWGTGVVAGQSRWPASICLMPPGGAVVAGAGPPGATPGATNAPGAGTLGLRVLTEGYAGG